MPKTTKKSTNKQNGEPEVLAVIAAMSGTDRELGKRIHDLIKSNIPTISSKLWYGMPAYIKDGKIICFFQTAQKFKTRYATLGFMHDAKLDEGYVWPVAFAVTKLTGIEEKKIINLLKKAVS